MGWSWIGRTELCRGMLFVAAVSHQKGEGCELRQMELAEEAKVPGLASFPCSVASRFDTHSLFYRDTSTIPAGIYQVIVSGGWPEPELLWLFDQEGWIRAARERASEIFLPSPGINDPQGLSELWLECVNDILPTIIIPEGIVPFRTTKKVTVNWSGAKPAHAIARSPVRWTIEAFLAELKYWSVLGIRDGASIGLEIEQNHFRIQYNIPLVQTDPKFQAGLLDEQINPLNLLNAADNLVEFESHASIREGCLVGAIGHRVDGYKIQGRDDLHAKVNIERALDFNSA